MNTTECCDKSARLDSTNLVTSLIDAALVKGRSGSGQVNYLDPVMRPGPAPLTFLRAIAELRPLVVIGIREQLPKFRSCDLLSARGVIDDHAVFSHTPAIVAGFRYVWNSAHRGHILNVSQQVICPPEEAYCVF